MTRDQVLEKLATIGIIPVVRAKSADQLTDLAAALIEGGVPVAEVTMTVPGAIDGIARLNEEFGDRLLLGVGSVTEASQAREAVAAGAEFVVSPVTVDEVVETAKDLEKVVIPGALTPTEIFRAWSMGADVVKVFPASVGGPKYFKAVQAPMPFLKLTPTGGVNLETAADFIKAGAVALGAGSALVEKQAVAEGSWARITELAGRFRDAIERARTEMG